MGATDPDPEFAAELRRWRAVRQLSQLELATRAGTTQRHISFLERGRSRPGRTVVVRLAESLDLTATETDTLLHAAGYAPTDEARRPSKHPAGCPLCSLTGELSLGMFYRALLLGRTRPE
ncbi:helix-turn-helix domain-containing protein [Yinghuangia soli]|uniref:helix-turn-helix domain-containing protein n=1 Tax=Yinghuangia soli TaxID=2908204 RepID=UPI0035563D55